MQGQFKRRLGPDEILRLRARVLEFPEAATIANIVREVAKEWPGMEKGALQDLVTVSRRLSEDSVRLYAEGKIGIERLSTIAHADFHNPSFRDSLAEKAATQGLGLDEIRKARDFILKGRTPAQAVDIIKGRRSEKPMTRIDELTLPKLITRLERSGLDWRRTFEMIRTVGQIQFVKDQRILVHVVEEVIRMEVARVDMELYLKRILEELPRDVVEHVVDEYRRTKDGPSIRPLTEVPLKLVDASELSSGDQPL